MDPESFWQLLEEKPYGSPIEVAGQKVDPWIKSAYWIVECGKEIISSHNDVWNEEAMGAYAAIFRMANQLKDEG